MVGVLALGPDGKTVLTGNDDTARLWDAATGQPLGPPLRHQGGWGVLAFRPDGRVVATGGGDTVRLWDAATGQPLGPPLQHTHPIFRLAFCPDGKGMLTVVAPLPDRDDGRWFAAVADSTAAPAARYQAQLWDTPAPVAGTAEHITLWTHVLSGMELDNGVGHMLDAPTWEERRQRLEQLGGPPPP
jgi:WD40 repeat protein